MLLFQDECAIYRQPSQGYLWASMGRQQPRVRLAARFNHCLRLVGYLNAVTGSVHSEAMKAVTVDRLISSIKRLPALYPHAERIYLVWDNWFNHRHARLLAALAKQPQIQCVWLPTYSPWLNPIEKLWRWLRQHVIHAHPWSESFAELCQAALDALHQLEPGSDMILRYTGLKSI